MARKSMPYEVVPSASLSLDDVIVHERLGLVEDLPVLGRDEHVFAAVQAQLQAALAGELDVQAGAVQEREVEPDQAAQACEASNAGGPGGAALALAGEFE